MCSNTYDVLIVVLVEAWGDLLQQLFVVLRILGAVESVVALVGRMSCILVHRGVVSGACCVTLQQAPALVQNQLVLLLFAQSDCKLLSLAQRVLIARWNHDRKKVSVL